jgi:hypothetical protein
MILAQKLGSSRGPHFPSHLFSHKSNPQHDLHEPDDTQTTIDCHHLDETMVWRQMMDEDDFGSEVGQLQGTTFSPYLFSHKSNPQHDLHEPDDTQTTIDCHHLGVSRDNGNPLAFETDDG